MTTRGVDGFAGAPSGAPSRWHEPAATGLLPIPDTVLTLFGARRRADDPRVLALRHALFEADPLADALVGWSRGLAPGRGRALVDRALELGVGAIADAPAPLADFFAAIDAEPPWLDREAVRFGAETMLRVGHDGARALGAASLMSGYLAGGAVKPLAATGALTTMAPRRLAETAKFVRDLATSGDLGRFSDGFKTTARVRLMHAFVRRELAGSPRWRADAWGVPINQRDMVGTVLAFLVAYVAGLTALGYLISRREREALAHLWRYVGLLLGIRAGLLPTTFAEALELARIFNLTEQGPDDDSRVLAAALVRAWSSEAFGAGGRGGAIWGRALVGYARFLLGKRAADSLALPDNAWKYAPLVVAPVRAALEVARGLAPGARERAVRRGRAVIEADLQTGLAGRPPDFQPRFVGRRPGVSS